jgi:hypothetical protein
VPIPRRSVEMSPFPLIEVGKGKQHQKLIQISDPSLSVVRRLAIWRRATRSDAGLSSGSVRPFRLATGGSVDFREPVFEDRQILPPDLDDHQRK